MPHLKNFIAENPSDWLEKLVEVYKIDAVTAGDLVSLKYDQINSPMAEPIVQECRGMVVHAPTGQILAHPYNKFWNHGERLATPIDWSTARVQDKLDGSLMILHWNPFEARWSVASSGNPAAAGRYGWTDMTFSEKFWQTFRTQGAKPPSRTDVCFMFELVAPDNRIVCRYDAPRVILHGARFLETEQEPSREWLEAFAQAHNWEIVKEFPLFSAEEALYAAGQLDPSQHEGYVVVDGRNNRVKIKSPAYVALHHLKGNGMVSPRRAIELWQVGEIGELLANFPELESDVKPVLDRLDSVAARAYGAYEIALRDNPDRKTFAMRVKDAAYAPICFKLFTMTNPVRGDAFQILRSMRVLAVEQMLSNLVWE